MHYRGQAPQLAGNSCSQVCPMRLGTLIGMKEERNQYSAKILAQSQRWAGWEWTPLSMSVPSPSLGKLSRIASGRRFSGRNRQSVQCVR